MTARAGLVFVALIAGLVSLADATVPGGGTAASDCAAVWDGVTAT